MKFLFVIQGEGRGHLTQAMTMEKILLRHGHEVVCMLVGKSRARELPSFFSSGVSAPVHRFDSFDFFSSAGNKRPDYFMTLLGNLRISTRFWSSIKLIKRTIRESGADVVLNYYELLGTIGWHRSGRKVPMVCIGHQFLLLHRDMKIPELGYEGKYALNMFSTAIANGASKLLALSFRPMENYGRIRVVPPLLRETVLESEPSEGDYILGYMLNAGFASEVGRWHAAHPDVPLHFFWDDRSHGDVWKVDDTLTYYYLNDKEFLRQMAGCRAYASTAGFESICEAMYMGKPLMMVPSHIEQKCNAWDATRYDAAVEAGKFDLSVLLEFADGTFRKDKGFPLWAKSAEDKIVSELENLGLKKTRKKLR